MPAPTLGTALGTGYMEIPAPVTSQPPNAAEAMPNLDPAFVTVWNATKYLIPTEWEGNRALIVGMANLAYRYKSATGSTTPVLSSINPTTQVHAVAIATLTCTGTSFDANAIIVFAGADQVTTQLSSTSLTCAIAATQISVAGNYAVAVRNGNNVVSATINLVVT
jgi:hypothetical protein